MIQFINEEEKKAWVKFYCAYIQIDLKGLLINMTKDEWARNAADQALEEYRKRCGE